MKPERPHFSLPFRFEGTHIAVNEQDSTDEIMACVECVTRTTISERETMPDFGRPDFTFETNRQQMQAGLVSALEEFEPRVQQLVEAELDADDELVTRLRALITPTDLLEEGTLDQSASP